MELFLAATNLVGIIPFTYYYRVSNNIGCVLILLSMLSGIHEHINTEPTYVLLRTIVAVCTIFYFTLGWWIMYRNKEPLYYLLFGILSVCISSHTSNTTVYVISHTLWHTAAYLSLYMIGRRWQ